MSVLPALRCMTIGMDAKTRYGAHRRTLRMQESLFPEKQAPKGYDLSQYVRILGWNMKNDIAIVSSTPGSVSTVRETMFIIKYTMGGVGTY
jgi:hypothetical protein